MLSAHFFNVSWLETGQMTSTNLYTNRKRYMHVHDYNGKAKGLPPGEDIQYILYTDSLTIKLFLTEQKAYKDRDSIIKSLLEIRLNLKNDFGINLEKSRKISRSRDFENLVSNLDFLKIPRFDQSLLGRPNRKRKRSLGTNIWRNQPNAKSHGSGR